LFYYDPLLGNLQMRNVNSKATTNENLASLRSGSDTTHGIAALLCWGISDCLSTSAKCTPLMSGDWNIKKHIDWLSDWLVFYSTLTQDRSICAILPGIRNWLRRLRNIRHIQLQIIMQLTEVKHPQTKYVKLHGK